jgi:hypothetical protein
MKRHQVLAALVAVLIPLPLSVLLFLAQHRASSAQSTLSPVLPREVRRQLLTYKRPCQKSADCEAPLGCLNHWRLKRPWCTDSECMTDFQCEGWESCQELETEGTGPRVRVCVTQGSRKEGEPCDVLPSSGATACEQGLRCLAGWCGRPCRTEDPASCPEGFFCADDEGNTACLPTCTARGCPEGQHCVRFTTLGEQAVTACATLHGTNCEQAGCPEAQRCLSQHLPRRPGEVWMSCVHECGQEGRTCPEGYACDIFTCRRLCDPQDTQTCGPAMRCAPRTADSPWMCRPDYWELPPGADSPP